MNCVISTCGTSYNQRHEGCRQNVDLGFLITTIVFLRIYPRHKDAYNVTYNNWFYEPLHMAAQKEASKHDVIAG